MPFGGAIQDMGKKDVQGILLVAKKQNFGQKEDRGQPRVSNLVKSLDDVLWAVAA